MKIRIEYFVPAISSALLLSSICFANPTQQPPQKVSIPRHQNNVVFEADLLIWVAKQEGNDYASTGTAITVPGQTDPNTSLIPPAITGPGQVYRPGSPVEPGFRVGLGVDLEYGKWEAFTDYTYFHSKATGSVASDTINTGIIPLFSYTPHSSILSETTYSAASGATGYVNSADSFWSLYFNNINLELRREMKLFPTLSLRPHFGFQGTWQHQDFQAVYQVASISSSSTNLGNNKILFHQTSWGVGLRLGLDGIWKCCKHLELYGNSAISALYGKFNARGRSYDTNFSAGYSHVLIADQLDKLYTVSPVIQAEIGVQSDWDFCNKYRFLVQAGWEEQVWFFQNQHSSTIADTSLVFQGLTLRFRFDF
jgi:hypothetical protein